MISLEFVGRGLRQLGSNFMKRFVLVALTFAAFNGIVLITCVIAQTAGVLAHTREKVASKPLPPVRPLFSRPSRGLSTAAGEQARDRHHRADPPSDEMTQCRPNDRKCEVERKLKGPVSDPGF
jgi:hypothetical protein